MTNAKELKKLLLAEVASKMRTFGYDGKVRGQSFRKQAPFGFFGFHLAFIDHGSDFDVTADVGIRFDKVEDLVNAGKKSLTEKEKAQTCTLGAELGNISEGVQRRWTIERATAVPGVASSIVAMYEAFGDRYLQQLSSPEAAYDVLSRDDKESWLHSPIHGARAMRAVALALVLGRYNELPNLISRKEAFLQDRNDFGLARFKEFAVSVVQDAEANSKLT